jgi:hypothetical protein
MQHKKLTAILLAPQAPIVRDIGNTYSLAGLAAINRALASDSSPAMSMRDTIATGYSGPYTEHS